MTAAGFYLSSSGGQPEAMGIAYIVLGSWPTTPGEYPTPGLGVLDKHYLLCRVTPIKRFYMQNEYI